MAKITSNQNSKKILCIYATRQIDSNLFMASTIFNSLMQTGVTVDMVFAAPDEINVKFNQQYKHYFHQVYNIIISPELKEIKSEKFRVLYSFWIHFIRDRFIRPYSKKQVISLKLSQYNAILSFVPPPISGLLGHDLRHWLKMDKVPLIQYWTDPLSLGRCNNISDIPPQRYFHKKIEHKILSYADKIVFYYPLLCEMEQKLHPEFSKKMTSGDVGYIPHHEHHEHPQNNTHITIGLFGAYQQRVRNIQPLLKAMKYFPNICFILRGDTDLSFDTKIYKNLDIIFGRRPIKEIEELESNCDILLCLGSKSGINVAGKAFYYCDYNKPIVYIGDGLNYPYLKKHLSEFENRYIVCENTVESICDGIKEAVDSLPTFKLKIPSRMHPENIVRKLLQEI